MREDELRRAFDALREHDRAAAPSFERMRLLAERRAKRRRARGLLAVTLASAAALLLAVVAASWPSSSSTPWTSTPWPSTPSPASSSSSAEGLVLALPAEPLAFLLEPPSASVVSARAPVDQIGEAW